MAGTERDGPTDDDSGLFDSSDAEPDSIDDDAKRKGHLASLSAKFGRGGDEPDVEADVDEGAGGGLLASVRGRLQDIEPGEPTRAELVDGANVLFIDPAAKRKSLYEYDLVLITAPQYPEPIVLKNDAPIEIPEGSVLCSAAEATMIKYRGKRVIARANILVPPDRADEVAPEYREDVPEPVLGKTIPQRGVQNEEFYNLVLNGVAASSK